jgi:hypothetical protein
MAQRNNIREMTQKKYNSDGVTQKDLTRVSVAVALLMVCLLVFVRTANCLSALLRSAYTFHLSDPLPEHVIRRIGG